VGGGEDDAGVVEGKCVGFRGGRIERELKTKKQKNSIDYSI